MSTTPKNLRVGPDGLIPIDSDHGNMSDRRVKAIRALAKDMVEFNRSNSLFAKGCRKAGIGYFQVAMPIYRVYCIKVMALNCLKAIPLVIDRWIDKFNSWLINL